MALPARNIFDGTANPTTGTMKAALGTLRDYLAGLLGTSGTPEDARAALGIPGRNRIINAHGRIRQRPTPNVSASYQYGPDRFLVAAIGGSSLSGVIGVFANSDMTAGLGIGAVGASWTSGQFFLQQRVEFSNVYDMRGKSVTISGKVYQDTGSSRNFYARALKANARDNFSSSTDLATSSVFAVPSGVATPFSFTFTLGSTDADNGLSVVVFDASASTISNKNIVVGDLQFELGSVATELEFVDYATELLRCQRYYASSTNVAGLLWSGDCTTGATYYARIRFPVTLRTSPTLITASVSAAGFPASVGALAATTQGLQEARIATSTGSAGLFESSWIASAEL